MTMLTMHKMVKTILLSFVIASLLYLIDMIFGIQISDINPKRLESPNRPLLPLKRCV